jgi:hypothetical protein
MAAGRWSLVTRSCQGARSSDEGHWMTRSLRFGLVGTGHWARITHAPALASTDGIEFAAVWGRNAGAAADLAASFHSGSASSCRCTTLDQLGEPPGLLCVTKYHRRGTWDIVAVARLAGPRQLNALTKIGL